MGWGLSLACGSYEAYFAELEPQYAVEHSETAFLNGLFRLFIQKDYQKQQSLSSLVIFPFYFALETGFVSY